MDNTLVSINCCTYNHEQYITDAIESFLMQKTDFKYEILIHDDASTDRTPEIIKKYEAIYPDLIKPIYQKENQFSKGVKVGCFNRERAKGKYIAICEGDDFWTDPYKLQRQVEYMEKHPECSMCTHAAYKVSSNKIKIGSRIQPNYGNKIFTPEEVIAGGGELFSTNSILYRTIFINNLPNFFKNAPVGDYPLAIYLALKGTVYYIDKFMSAYRIGVSGSWTDREFWNIERRTALVNNIAIMLDEVNIYSNYLYDISINKTKKNNQIFLLLEQGLFKDLKKGELRTAYLELSFKDRLYIVMKQFCPSILKASIKIIRLLSRLVLRFMEQGKILKNLVHIKRCENYINN